MSKFIKGQEVEVNVRHWLGQVVETLDPMWKPTRIVNVFENKTYATTLGVFIEDAIRAKEGGNHGNTGKA